MLLEGRAAVVAGVGPGMGRAIAVGLAREGASVALAARHVEKLEPVAAEVSALGARAVCAPANVIDEEACRAVADAAVSAFGRLDVLVCNAFIQPPMQRVEDNDMKVWRKAFEVNVLGALNMVRACAPAMRKAGGGSIVFVSSMSARVASEGMGAYSASKSALMTAAVTLARELGPDGIRVNCVVPGYIDGPNLRWWFGQLASERGTTPEAVYEEIASETALRHLPTSEEVADAIVFLASDRARAITGQALDVNGGHWFD